MLLSSQFNVQKHISLLLGQQSKLHLGLHEPTSTYHLRNLGKREKIGGLATILLVNDFQPLESKTVAHRTLGRTYTQSDI